MTIILFLIDTSASMCQKVHVNGVQKTYLDVAKGAVETFLKFRQRSQDCMGDRYMLLTFEEPPSNVKAGWKENHATFMNELKNLQSNGLTCMGEALKNGFDLLNLNRMQSGIDTYGQGRCPFYLETSVIIVITDGGKYSFRNGVHNEIVLPLHAQIPGTKLTKEPFRWDQRLFSLVLRMAGHRVDERIDVKVPHDDSPIEKMCEVTGGRSYKIRSHYVLNHCIESLVQKVQAGVVVQFEPPLALNPKQDAKELGEQPHLTELAFQMTKKMIYVQKNMNNKNYPIGYWPLPEPYWPDPKATQLPPRDAHPRIRILTPCVDEPVPVRNFPVDKYELEPSQLTMQILARREMNRCWPVVVVNSGPSVVGGPGSELPFGYLKANNTFTQVFLVVLPINYPVLLPLLHDLLHRYMGNPPNDWMYKFNNYVRSIPQYYCPFLRRALASISVPYQLLSYIIPENLDSYLSQPVANHLKALKNAAKQDLEAQCIRIFKQLKHPKPPHKQIETAKLLPILSASAGAGAAANSQSGVPQLGVAPPINQQPIGGPRKEMVSHPMLRDTFAKVHSECQFHDNYTIVVPVATVRGQLTGSAQVTHATGINGGGQGASQQGGPPGGGVGPPARNSRNPFDIRRRDLVDEIARMRENFFKMVGPSGGLTSATNGVNGAAGHCLPISEMGNYQEYLKNKETPLREIEPTNVRQHMFGNPYKKDKNMVMVDEADLVGDVAPMMKSGGGMPGSPNPGSPMLFKNKMGEGVVGGSKMRKRKAGPIARDFKFRRLSTSSVDSYGSSGRSCEYGSDTSSVASDDLDDEEQPLVMDFDESMGGQDQGPTAIGNSEDGPADVGVKLEANGGRLNGSGGVKEEEREVDRRLGLLPSVPVVLTPSEGVLSPVYQQAAASPHQQMPVIVQPGTGVNLLASTTSQSPVNATQSASPVTNASGSPSLLGAVAASKAHLSNGTTGTSAGGLERSSSSTSNYNDADEISKILQQSCSQHNGGSSASESERKKQGSRTEEEDNNSAPASTATTSRKRRQMTKQPSSETLELNDTSEEKEEAVGRRQSPRGGGTVSAGGKANSGDRLGNKDEEQSSTGNHNSNNNNNHVKGSWSSRRKGAKNNHHAGGSTATAKEDQERGEVDGDEERVPSTGSPTTTDVWLVNGESVDAIREANFAVRTTLFHDIRRPGRDYGQLLEHLEMIRGDFETQFAFIQMCIAEAMRFHRKKMATTIQEWWDQKIDKITRSSGTSLNSNSNNNSRSNNNGNQSEPPAEPTVIKAIKAESASSSASSGKSSSGGGGGRQKSNVKLRSTVPSKC